MSYALGIILAMGLGLSYAYAVGANDSNAFVTKTEWQTKVAQLESSLDNVRRTVKDANMDFFMNGPRLQASLVEGLENVGGQDYVGIMFTYTNGTGWNASYSDRFSWRSEIVLQDMWDGTQSINKYGYYGASLSGAEYHAKCKFALRSNEDPDVYLIFSYYYLTPELQLAEVTYYNIGLGKITPETAYYNTARTFSVTLDIREWWTYRVQGAARSATNGPFDIPRTSSGIYSGTPGDSAITRERMPYATNNSGTYGNLSNPGTGYVSETVTGNLATYRYEFPATACTLRTTGAPSTSGAVFNHFPLNLNGRKYGGPYDRLYNSNSSYAAISKVYSPQKGCLALKSALNGEIPIFNE